MGRVVQQSTAQILRQFSRDQGERIRGDCAVDAVLGTQVYLRSLWNRLSGDWPHTLEALRALATRFLQTG